MGMIAAFLFFGMTGCGIFGDLPDIRELENPKSNLASEIYSADGVMIGKYFLDNRTNVLFDELAPSTVDALVSTEDQRFYEHSGIDIKGTLRAIILLGKEGGGSTITQQLAKNMFNDTRRKNVIKRIIEKAQEYIIAIRLEKRYTKNEIIAMYLNTVDFVNNAVGIHSAAHVYFNKLPKDLTVEESAVLIGMLKAPSYYNPVRNPQISKGRRNVVLNQMVKNKKLTGLQYNELKDEDIQVHFNPISHVDGLAPYFREILALELKTWLRENPRQDGTTYNLYKDGLKIYTTIDSRMQKYAESAVREHLSKYQTLFSNQYKGSNVFDVGLGKERLALAIKNSDRYRKLKVAGMSDKEIENNFNKAVPMKVFSWQGEKDTTMTPKDSIKYHMMFLQTGFMAMDAETGYIKAWVGGIDFKYFKYDHVNVNTKRQVGSTYKPVLYTLAIDNGWSPCISVPAGTISIKLPAGNVWTVKGAGGEKTIKRCLATSDNACAAYLVKQLGADAMVQMGERMGITTKLPAYPAMALGAGDISLYEMVTVYSCFPSGGLRTKPLMVTRVEDKNGNLIKAFSTEQVEAFSKNTAYKMVDVMKGVVETGGTGNRLKRNYNLGNLKFAGKTGTTNKNVDAWFMGYSPNLVAGVWVGNDEQFLRFKTTYLGQGAAAALPIWGKFFEKVVKDSHFKDIVDADFFTPDDTTLIRNVCQQDLEDFEGFAPLDDRSIESQF
ncbi:MAG: transglycosylase domain-containing protein [Chitinophagales bacterium]|nr:transglycosylase domain-containing protein [Chitinophagales bacterium]